jgi:hypothetical protein
MSRLIDQASQAGEPIVIVVSSSNLDEVNEELIATGAAVIDVVPIGDGGSFSTYAVSIPER